MSTGFKFDPQSPAAQKLKDAAYQKVKEVFDPTIEDDSISQYIVTLASKGQDKKRLTTNLNSILGETTPEVIDWLLTYIKSHRQELESSKKAPAAPKPVPAPKPAPAPTPAPVLPPVHSDGIDNVEALLREGEEGGLNGGLDELEEYEQQHQQQHQELQPPSQPEQDQAADEQQHQQQQQPQEAAPGDASRAGGRARSQIQWKEESGKGKGEGEQHKGAREWDKGKERTSSRDLDRDRDRHRERERDRDRGREHEREREREERRRERFGGPDPGDLRRRGSGRSRSRSPPGGWHGDHMFDRMHVGPGPRGGDPWGPPHPHPMDGRGPWDRHMGPPPFEGGRMGFAGGRMGSFGHPDMGPRGPGMMQPPPPPRRLGSAVVPPETLDVPADSEVQPEPVQSPGGGRKLRSTIAAVDDTVAAQGGTVDAEGAAAVDTLQKAGSRMFGRSLAALLGGGGEGGARSRGAAGRTQARGSAVLKSSTAQQQQGAPGVGLARNAVRGILGRMGSQGAKRRVSDNGGDLEDPAHLPAEEDDYDQGTATVGVQSPSKLPRRAGAAAAAADVAAARGRAAGSTQGALAQRLLAGAGQLPGAVAAAQPRGGLAARVAGRAGARAPSGTLQQQQELQEQEEQEASQEEFEVELHSPGVQGAAAPGVGVGLQAGRGRGRGAAAGGRVPGRGPGPGRGRAVPAAGTTTTGQPAAPPTAAAGRPAGTGAAGAPPAANGTAAGAGAAQGGQSEMAALKEQLKRMEQEINSMKGKVVGATAKQQQPEVDGRSVVVNGLPIHVTEQVVYAHFAAVALVNRLTLIKNHATGLPIGTAYVEFDDPEGAKNALKLTGLPLLGQPITVKPKVVRRAPPPAARPAAAAAQPTPAANALKQPSTAAGSGAVAANGGTAAAAGASTGASSGAPAKAPARAASGSAPGAAAASAGGTHPQPAKRLAEASTLPRKMVWKRADSGSASAGVEGGSQQPQPEGAAAAAGASKG